MITLLADATATPTSNNDLILGLAFIAFWAFIAWLFFRD